MAEDLAVDAAIAELALHRGALELDTAESAAMATSQAAAPLVLDMDAQLAAMADQLGMPAESQELRALVTQRASGAAEFDAFLWREQSALVEGMVRAYARRRLRLLLGEFEVLEVEREGEWELSRRAIPGDIYHDEVIWFMSRPDALLRSRADNSLYLLSFKTAASWDVRKARDAEHDMQGLSEGVEVERRLGEWWKEIRETEIAGGDWDELPNMSDPMFDYLRDLPAPPRILGIRMEYMLKGDRWADRDLSAKVGFDARSQRSHLVRAYVGKKDDAALNWAWDYVKETGEPSKLAWQSWSSRPVWDRMSVKAWIDLLDQSTEAMSAYDATIGQEPRALGWQGPAQATGFTAQHPLDAVFVAPITIYRQDQDLFNWLEQTEYAERRVAEGVAVVESATDEGERISALNQHFPQSRRACSYPTECAFARICYGGEDIQRAPLESGLYRIRKVNHPQELTGFPQTNSVDIPK